MKTPSTKGIFIILLIASLAVTAPVIPDIISQYMADGSEKMFGKGYEPYFLAYFVVGSVVFLFLTTDFGKYLRPSKPETDHLYPAIPDPILIGKIRSYLITRYKHRLSQKLAGRQPVNLRILPSLAGTSPESAENYITLQEEEVRAAIGDIFDRANGRLLIVGLPGFGKTTLVLQLALHLLERSSKQMPAVLNLATWRTEFGTFDNWLRQILPAELGASKGLADQIWKNSSLVLLLDGLDEVPEADRDSCLTAIGEFGVDASRQFLISSRIDEYAGTKDAPVYVQVEVEQLTIEQVEAGLLASVQPESRRLLNALKRDPLLRQAVENPFYLNTAQLLFASGKNWSEFGFVAENVAGRQRELVERFVDGALARKAEKDYLADKAQHWLSFLASRMSQRNMVVFELRDLQPGWNENWNFFEKNSFLLLNEQVMMMGQSWLMVGIFGIIFIPILFLKNLLGERTKIHYLFNHFGLDEQSMLGKGLFGPASLILLMLSTFVFIVCISFFTNLIRMIKGKRPHPLINTIDVVPWKFAIFAKNITSAVREDEFARPFIFMSLFLLFCVPFLSVWCKIPLIASITGILVICAFCSIMVLTISLQRMIIFSNYSLLQIAHPYQRFYASMKVFLLFDIRALEFKNIVTHEKFPSY